MNNEQINRPQTTRTRRPEITEINNKITSNATYDHTTMYVRPEVNFRLPDFIIPKKYKIDLRLNTEEDIFYGISDISIEILKTTQNISLHSANLEINRFISFLTKIIGEQKIVYVTRNIIYIPELQIVVLDFVDTLPPDKYNLTIWYKGVIANDVGGFIKISYRNATGDKK
ncbi:hypothetical protein P5V15_004982 [Pogonomyrmex californicus]